MTRDRIIRTILDVMYENNGRNLLDRKKNERSYYLRRPTKTTFFVPRIYKHIKTIKLKSHRYNALIQFKSRHSIKVLT